MSDNDLIRRGDALYAIAGWEIPSTAIAALPAVTVKANLQLTPAPDAAALSATEIDDSKTPDPVAYAAGYAAALREAAAVAKYYAEQDYCWMGYPEDGGIAASGTAHTIERDILALLPKGGDGRQVYMGQIMAECDCQREAECQAAGRCIAEERR